MNRIINCETGEITETPIDPSITAELLASLEPTPEMILRQEQKQAAEAKLAALGLTSEDLKALGLG